MPKIIELARTDLIKLNENSSSLQDIAELMLEKNVGSIVIVDDKDDVVGFVDEKSILKIISDGNNPHEFNIKQIMKKFPTINKDLSVLDAYDEIKENKEERYGIVNDDSKIIGIIRKRTINDFRVRILKEELHIE